VLDQQRKSSQSAGAALAFWVAFSITTPLIGGIEVRPVFAQDNPTSPASANSANNGLLRVQGSASMRGVSEVLAERFQERAQGSNLEITYTNAQEAIQAVLNGTADLAAIGRSLTEQETNQGLRELPVARDKIAIIVGEDNSFDGSITIEQFAQIVRGEITDWSELGGAPGPIRFVDHPSVSDTRQALQAYPVFQAAPFQPGANTETVAEDTVDDVVEALGANGISYAPAHRVLEDARVRTLPMHNVMPTDEQYPFSQPLVYVYRDAETNALTEVFLGVASDPESQAVVESARIRGTLVTAQAPANLSEIETEAASLAADAETPAPGGAPVAEVEGDPTAEGTMADDPEVTAATELEAGPAAETDQTGGFPWWILLIPLLGGLLWWWLKGRGAAPAAAPIAAGAAAPVEAEACRLILTPRNCQDAYAYWEVSDSVMERFRREGGETLKLRLYDVTDLEVRDMDLASQPSVQDVAVEGANPDLHLAIAQDNRDYLAELGYVTREGQWLSVVRSPQVRVPACEPVGGKGSFPVAAVAGAAATGIAATRLSQVSAGKGSRSQGAPSDERVPNPDLVIDDSRLILVPRSADDLYAYWELSDAQTLPLHNQGRYPLSLRVYDTTAGEPVGDAEPGVLLHEYPCPEGQIDQHIPIPAPDRDYLGELGYVNSEGNWVKIARSAATRVPSGLPTLGKPQPAIAGSSNLGTPNGMPRSAAMGATATAAGAIGLGAAALGDRPRSHPQNGETTQVGQGQIEQGECQIILVPRNATDAYVYWEVTDQYKQPLRAQGGQTLMLRVHDATNLDIDVEEPHSTQEFPVSESDQDRHIQIPMSDRDYIAELGYYTADQRWLRIIRSFHTHVPADTVVL
jgi:phosphate transport system substrate-binding protein